MRWFIAADGKGGRVALVIGLLSLLALGFAAARLQMDFDPEDMVAGVASVPCPDFESDDAKPWVLVLRHEDVLDPAFLGPLREVIRALSEIPQTSVQSIGNMPLPQWQKRKEETLDALEAAGDDEADFDGPTTEALGQLAADNPERYPLGLVSLAQSMPGHMKVGACLTASSSLKKASACLESSRDLLQPRWISKDATSTLLLIEAKGDVAKKTEQIQQTLQRLALPASIEVSLTGLPVLQQAVRDRLGWDQVLLVPITIFANLLVLLFLFRSPLAISIPLMVAGCAAGLVLGGMALMQVPLDLVNNVIAPLLISIGLADALHIVLRFFELRDRDNAALLATRELAPACLLTSLTTAAGFIALAFSSTPILSSFGIVASIGVMLALLLSLGFVPSFLRVFEQKNLARPVSSGSGWVGRVVGFSFSHPVFAILGSIAITAMLIPCLLDVTVDTRLLDPFDESDSEHRNAAFVDLHLGGIRSFDVVVAALDTEDPKVIHALGEWVEDVTQLPGVQSVSHHKLRIDTAYERITGQTPPEYFASKESVRALRQLSSASTEGPNALFTKSALRLRVGASDIGSKSLTQTVLRVERSGAEHFGVPRTQVSSSGEAVRAGVGLTRLTEDLLYGLLAASIAIFLLLLIGFRDLRLALVSIPPNLLPLFFTLAWMGLRGLRVDAVAAIVLTVSVGLAVDGTIHLLIRYRRTESDVPTRLAHAARGVWGASLTLLAGFAVLMLSGFRPIRIFGELALVTLVACIFADLILLPALLALGKTNPPT